jgi:hypothetical protein
LPCYPFSADEFSLSNEPLFVCVAKVVQDFPERSSRDAKKLSELLVFETSHVAFGDISRRRSDGIAQLIGESELSLEVWSAEEFIHSQLQLVRQLPGENLLKLLESSHSGLACNRAAEPVPPELAPILWEVALVVARIATSAASECRKSCI